MFKYFEIITFFSFFSGFLLFLVNYVDMCIFGKCLYLTAEDDDSHITEIKFKNMI